MFKKDKETTKYTVETENLAVPEVHTGKVKHDKIEENKVSANDNIEIDFGTLAVPEIHIKKKKQ